MATETQTARRESVNRIQSGDRRAPNRPVSRPTTRKRLPPITPRGAALRMRRRGQERKKGVEGKQVQKLGGLTFWLVAVLALIKDLLDIILHAAFLLSVLIIPITLLISLTILMYYFFSGVKPSAKKAFVLIWTAMCELVPIISLFPFAFISLFLIRYLENRSRKRRARGKTGLIGKFA